MCVYLCTRVCKTVGLVVCCVSCIVVVCVALREDLREVVGAYIRGQFCGQSKESVHRRMHRRMTTNLRNIARAVCASTSPFRLPISPSHYSPYFLTSPSFVSSFLSLVHSVIPRTKGTVAGLAGHTNHRQKIHLLDKVMKENRALKKENAVLQTKVVHTRRPAGGAGKKD